MGVVIMCVDMYFPQCVCGGWRQPPGVDLFFYSGIWGSILGHTAYKSFYPEDFYLVSPAQILFVRLIFSYLNSSSHFLFVSQTKDLPGMPDSGFNLGHRFTFKKIRKRNLLYGSQKLLFP